MTEWQDATLGDFLTLQRGFDLTQRDATPGAYPVISSGGVAYTTDVAKVDGPGVVTGRKGVLGKVHFSAGPFWPHDTTLWVKDFKGADPRFVYYLLQTLPLASLDAGASNPTLNRNHAHLLRVRVPPPIEQARIAQILGGIDDLIENNRRRVEVLEAMAQAIYREWLVRFRYPGHDDVPLVDSPLGPIPQGWSVATLGDLATLARPSIQPSRSPSEVFDHYSIPAFDDGLHPVVEQGDAIRSGKYLLDAPAVLVSKLNPRIERTWFAVPTSERRAVTSTEFLILRPRKCSTLTHLYLVARSDGFQARLRELSGGTSTSHQRARPDDFLGLEVVSPPAGLVRELDERVANVLSLAGALRRQGRIAASLRDLLLPNLVTGGIDVSSLRLDALAEGAIA